MNFDRTLRQDNGMRWGESVSATTFGRQYNRVRGCNRDVNGMLRCPFRWNDNRMFRRDWQINRMTRVTTDREINRVLRANRRQHDGMSRENREVNRVFGRARQNNWMSRRSWSSSFGRQYDRVSGFTRDIDWVSRIPRRGQVNWMFCARRLNDNWMRGVNGNVDRMSRLAATTRGHDRQINRVGGYSWRRPDLWRRPTGCDRMSRNAGRRPDGRRSFFYPGNNAGFGWHDYWLFFGLGWLASQRACARNT
jgi:hypothetical protein